MRERTDHEVLMERAARVLIDGRAPPQDQLAALGSAILVVLSQIDGMRLECEAAQAWEQSYRAVDKALDGVPITVAITGQPCVDRVRSMREALGISRARPHDLGSMPRGEAERKLRSILGVIGEMRAGGRIAPADAIRIDRVVDGGPK